MPIKYEAASKDATDEYTEWTNNLAGSVVSLIMTTILSMHKSNCNSGTKLESVLNTLLEGYSRDASEFLTSVLSHYKEAGDVESSTGHEPSNSEFNRDLLNQQLDLTSFLLNANSMQEDAELADLYRNTESIDQQTDLTASIFNESINQQTEMTGLCYKRESITQQTYLTGSCFDKESIHQQTEQAGLCSRTKSANQQTNIRASCFNSVDQQTELTGLCYKSESINQQTNLTGPCFDMESIDQQTEVAGLCCKTESVDQHTNLTGSCFDKESVNQQTNLSGSCFNKVSNSQQTDLAGLCVKTESVNQQTNLIGDCFARNSIQQQTKVAAKQNKDPDLHLTETAIQCSLQSGNIATELETDILKDPVPFKKKISAVDTAVKSSEIGLVSQATQVYIWGRDKSINTKDTAGIRDDNYDALLAVQLQPLSDLSEYSESLSDAELESLMKTVKSEIISKCESFKTLRAPQSSCYSTSDEYEPDSPCQSNPNLREELQLQILSLFHDTFLKVIKEYPSLGKLANFNAVYKPKLQERSLNDNCLGKIVEDPQISPSNTINVMPVSDQEPPSFKECPNTSENEKDLASNAVDELSAFVYCHRANSLEIIDEEPSSTGCNCSAISSKVNCSYGNNDEMSVNEKSGPLSSGYYSFSGTAKESQSVGALENTALNHDKEPDSKFANEEIQQALPLLISSLEKFKNKPSKDDDIEYWKSEEVFVASHLFTPDSAFGKAKTTEENVATTSVSRKTKKISKEKLAVARSRTDASKEQPKQSKSKNKAALPASSSTAKSQEARALSPSGASNFQNCPNEEPKLISEEPKRKRKLSRRAFSPRPNEPTEVPEISTSSNSSIELLDFTNFKRKGKSRPSSPIYGSRAHKDKGLYEGPNSKSKDSRAVSPNHIKPNLNIDKEVAGDKDQQRSPDRSKVNTKLLEELRSKVENKAPRSASPTRSTLSEVNKKLLQELRCKYRIDDSQSYASGLGSGLHEQEKVLRKQNSEYKNRENSPTKEMRSRSKSNENGELLGLRPKTPTFLSRETHSVNRDLHENMYSKYINEEPCHQSSSINSSRCQGGESQSTSHHRNLFEQSKHLSETITFEKKDFSFRYKSKERELNSSGHTGRSEKQEFREEFYSKGKHKRTQSHSPINNSQYDCIDPQSTSHKHKSRFDETNSSYKSTKTRLGSPSDRIHLEEDQEQTKSRSSKHKSKKSKSPGEHGTDHNGLFEITKQGACPSIIVDKTNPATTRKSSGRSRHSVTFKNPLEESSKLSEKSRSTRSTQNQQENEIIEASAVPRLKYDSSTKRTNISHPTYSIVNDILSRAAENYVVNSSPDTVMKRSNDQLTTRSRTSSPNKTKKKRNEQNNALVPYGQPNLYKQSKSGKANNKCGTISLTIEPSELSISMSISSISACKIPLRAPSMEKVLQRISSESVQSVGMDWKDYVRSMYARNPFAAYNGVDLGLNAGCCMWGTKKQNSIESAARRNHETSDCQSTSSKRKSGSNKNQKCHKSNQKKDNPVVLKTTKQSDVVPKQYAYTFYSPVTPSPKNGASFKDTKSLYRWNNSAWKHSDLTVSATSISEADGHLESMCSTTVSKNVPFRRKNAIKPEPLGLIDNARVKSPLAKMPLQLKIKGNSLPSNFVYQSFVHAFSNKAANKTKNKYGSRVSEEAASSTAINKSQIRVWTQQLSKTEAVIRGLRQRITGLSNILRLSD